MAPLQNLFALIETEEEDVSAIALAAIKADQQKLTQQIETNTKPRNVHNSMMTKSNRHILPNGWRPQRQFTNKYQERHSNYRKQTENQLSDANGNGKFSNGAKHTNNAGNNGQTNGFQGNFRRNFGGPNGYQGNRRGYNRYGRNRRYPANNLQGNNGPKKEVVVDADGWQVYVGRHGHKRGEITPENRSQSGRNEVHYTEINRSSFNGGDRGKVGNYGVEGSSRSVSENGVESEKLDHSGVEAGSNAATEGDRDSKGLISSRESRKKRSGKGKNEGQDDSKSVKKEEEEYKVVFTLKEYEEAQLEKRKALESIKQTEQRKVTLDKDFESMLVLDKRDNDEKPNWEKEADAKKKESIKGGKITKVMNVDELWKAANCIEERKRMRMLERLKRNKGEEKQEETKRSQKSNAQIAAAAAAVFVADANQFPALSALH